MTTSKKQALSRKKKTDAAEPSRKAPGFDSEPLDQLLRRLESLEREDQGLNDLLTDTSLLSSTMRSLLSLATKKSVSTSDSEKDWTMTVDALEKEFTRALKDLSDHGCLSDGELDDLLADDGDSDGDSDYDSEVEDSDEELPANKELEMLMEEVEDESDLDDDDYATEDDEEEEEEEEEKGRDGVNKDTRKRDLFNEDDPESVGLSSFERAQLALKAQIASLEEENIQTEKPWVLRGEINARQRPSDSLLEEAIEFEQTSRPVPQVTEERTEEIEDIIKRRIAEAAWDDVERKDGRDLTLLNGTKPAGPVAKPLLEDVATAGEKKSLSKVYEEEYQSKVTKESPADEETKEKRSTLTTLFAKICRHMDGLSGNRFAPKVYAQSEIQVQTLGKK